MIDYTIISKMNDGYDSQYIHDSITTIENKYNSLSLDDKAKILLLTSCLLKYQNKSDNDFDFLCTDEMELIINYGESFDKFQEQIKKLGKKDYEVISKTYVHRGLYREISKFIKNNGIIEDTPPLINEYLDILGGKGNEYPFEGIMRLIGLVSDLYED